MMLKGLFVASAVAGSLAFVPPVHVAPAGGVVARQASALNMGYVPDGLTEAEYAKIQAEEAAKRAKNRAAKAGKKVEDLTEWLKKRDQQYPNQPGAGHTFAKTRDPEAGVPAAARGIIQGVSVAGKDKRTNPGQQKLKKLTP